MTTTTKSPRQEFIDQCAAGDHDALIRDLDEGNTKRAIPGLYEKLAILIVPYNAPCSGWFASVVNSEDHEQEYEGRRFSEISEAAEWSAAALDKIAADADEAIQDQLQDRMKEMRAQARSDSGMPWPHR